MAQYSEECVQIKGYTLLFIQIETILIREVKNSVKIIYQMMDFKVVKHLDF